MENVGDSQRLGGILNIGEERRSSARERGGGGEVEEEWERDGSILGQRRFKKVIGSRTSRSPTRVAYSTD